MLSSSFIVPRARTVCPLLAMPQLRKTRGGVQTGKRESVRGTVTAGVPGHRENSRFQRGTKEALRGVTRLALNSLKEEDVIRYRESREPGHTEE